MDGFEDGQVALVRARNVLNPHGKATVEAQIELYVVGTSVSDMMDRVELKGGPLGPFHYEATEDIPKGELVLSRAPMMWIRDDREITLMKWLKDHPKNPQYRDLHRCPSAPCLLRCTVKEISVLWIRLGLVHSYKSKMAQLEPYFLDQELIKTHVLSQSTDEVSLLFCKLIRNCTYVKDYGWLLMERGRCMRYSCEPNCSSIIQTKSVDWKEPPIQKFPFQVYVTKRDIKKGEALTVDPILEHYTRDVPRLYLPQSYEERRQLRLLSFGMSYHCECELCESGRLRKLRDVQAKKQKRERRKLRDSERSGKNTQ